MADFKTVIEKRYSVREYTSRPVEQEKVEQLKSALLLTPSAKAIYPCEYYFVKDRVIIQSLSKSKQRGIAFLAQAPLALVIAANEEESDVWAEDASVAATYALLQAVDLDLGACWIHIKDRVHNEDISSEDYVKDLLAIPGHMRVLCIISIGYSADNTSKASAYNTSKVHQIG